MSKIKHIFRGRKWLRNLVTILLCLVVVGGVVGGVVALTRNTDKIEEALTYKSIGWTKYSIGGLATNGAYMSTDHSIYTEKAFECQGLNVTPVFDSDVSYQIYFYDQNNEFVHTTGRLTGTFVQDSVPFFAKYARIVVTPNNDNKVTIFEKAKYAKQIEVKVYREQGFVNYTDNLVEVDESTIGYVLNGSGEVVAHNEAEVVSKYINVMPYRESLIYREQYTNIDNKPLHVYDSAKNHLGTILVGESAKICFTTSEGVNYYSLSFSDLIIHSDANSNASVAFIRTSGAMSAMEGIYCR